MICTKINLKYLSYNSPWSEFLLAFITTTSAIQYLWKDYNSNYLMPLGIYNIHNLHSQYQYNKSLEHEIKVKINGIEETVKASPQYWDYYTSYNAASLSTCILLISGGMLLGTSHPLSAYIEMWAVFSFLVATGSKVLSLKDTYQEFQYTDSQGNIISPEVILDHGLIYIVE